MIKRLLLFCILIIPRTIYISGQDISQNFKYYSTLPRPTDLKHALPHGILLDTIKAYLMIAYDYHPTYVEIFETQNFNKIKRIQIWNYIYMSESYFSDDGQFIYFDIGRWKNNYYRFDLKTFEKKHISCRNAPKGCDYDNWEDEKSSDGLNKVVYCENYIIKYNKTEVKIYLKMNN